MVRDQNGRPRRQLTLDVARVEIEERGPAQQIMQERERAPHDALQQPRAASAVARWKQ